MKELSNTFKVIILAFLFSSCSNSENESVHMKSFEGPWKAKDTQKFDFEITDANNHKNIIFVVRNNNDYPYSNIRFFVDFTDLKTKKSVRDTMNYVLANPNGQWLGSGFGDTKEILFQYKMKYKFPANGKYQINLTQAMRKEDLPGVEDVGVMIETAKP